MAEKAQALSPDTQLFRDVFNASPVGIVVENIEGQPLFANPAFCSMLGFSEEELCNKHCVQFSPPEDAQKDWALFQQLRARSIDHYQLEKRYFRRDGSLVWGRLSVSLLNGRASPLVIAIVEDITDKKKAEEVRLRHTAIVESSEDAIMSVTLDRTISTWNAAAERIYGYTEAEAVGQPIDMIVPPELPDEENKILETLRAGGRIEQLETVRITKTGKRINVSLSISPIRDATGEVVGCSGIARDITECKRAEEALRKSEERFRLAAQAGKMYAYEWDVATDMIVRSGDIGRVLGSTGEASLTSQKLLARVHPDDRALFDASVAECTGEHPDVQISYRLLRPDGSVVWLEKTARAFFDGQDRVVRMIGMVADITERRLAEEARFRHAAIVESSEDAIISKNLDAVIVSWNPGAQHIFGYTESESVGQPITILIPPESWDEENKILERLRAGEHIDHYETVRVTKAGNTINVSLSLSPIKDSTGRIMGFCKIARDITERKRAEEARRESEERLRLAAQIGRMFAYSWDAATDVIERSGESAEILGVQKQAAATGATVSAMVHPDDKERLEVAMARLSLDNPMLHITYRILRPDGAVIWLERNSRAYFDGNGKVKRMVGMVVDVTERKRAKEALADMTRKLITAQEQERARIGRELHDDINQRSSRKPCTT